MNMAIISNGRGEDWIALNLIMVLQANPKHAITTFPLVGNGDIYKQHQLPVKTKNPTFPSGGFIRSLSTLITDIRHGLIQHIYSQIKLIKHQRKSIDMVIAVGDIFCLFIASFSNKPIYFLPTAKSDHFMPHSFIERWFIRKVAKKSYPRDLQTTTNFQQHQLKAAFFGNPMMDHLRCNTPIIPVTTNKKVIGILPGSRKEAHKNMAFILDICETLSEKKQLYFACAWVSKLDINTLISTTNWTLLSSSKQKTVLQNNTKTCHVLFSDQFKSIINQASLCIGLAGTANEQALYLEKPVVCFEGFGPQSTLQRFKEQQQLMGPLLTICDRNINTICSTILSLLETTKDIPQKNNPSKPASNQIITDIMTDAASIQS